MRDEVTIFFIVALVFLTLAVDAVFDLGLFAPGSAFTGFL